MPSYVAPTRDARFIVNELLKLDGYADLPGFADASADFVSTIIDETGKFSAQVLAPINQAGDAEGCTRNADASVSTPTGFKAAFGALREAGWSSLSHPTEFGGQGLPH